MKRTIVHQNVKGLIKRRFGTFAVIAAIAGFLLAGCSCESKRSGGEDVQQKISPVQTVPQEEPGKMKEEKSSPKQTEENAENAEMITGSVKHVGVEGGFFGLLADDGQKYDPMNLASEYRKDGLRVKFQVEEVKGVMGTHMWGKIVKIIKIEKL